MAHTNEMPVSRGAEFLHALNTAAAYLQRSSHSEAEIFATFKEQVASLGLAGALTLLDTRGERLVFHAVAFPSRLMTTLESLTGLKAEGLSILIDQVETFHQLLTTGEALFIPDMRKTITQIFPPKARQFTDQVLNIMGPRSSIFAPLIIEGKISGTINMSGKGLSPQEIPAIVAFANHISIALENARLFQALRRDLAERQEAEEALRQSEARFKILAENAPGVIYLCQNDLSFTMLYLNDAVATLTGYTKEEFLENGLTFGDLYHPDDAPFILPEDDHQLKENGTFHLTYRIKHRSGEWRWVEDFGGGVFDELGNLLFLSGFLSDVTERRQAQEALQESQRTLSTLMSNLPGMAYRSRNDAHWTVEFASEGCMDLIGYEPVELQFNETLSYSDIIHPADRQHVWDEVQVALAERRAFRLIYRIITKEGAEKWVWEQGRGVFSSEGELLFLEGFITDITERKNAEGVLRHAQKMESLGVLAGGVAHDFNNLLVAILGQTSLALAKLSPENSVRHHIEKAVTAAERAADLTRQLLAYSGRGQFAVAPLNLNRLIEENLHLLEVTIPKHIHLQLDLADPLPPIEADRGQMQQVIMNLIINATEAIGQQAGRVIVTTRLRTINEDNSAYCQFTNLPLSAGSYVSLNVTDNGAGIDEGTLTKIFDPFFTTKFTGRGLGLAAVLGIVRGHKGGLRIDSGAGQGTTFELLLPAIEVQLSDSSNPQAFETPPSRTSFEFKRQQERILVIDDEAPVREAIIDIMEMENVHVLTAANGMAGIKLYRERFAEINLVVLDLSMPGLSGEETFRELLRINPKIKVILSSGYSETEVNRRFEGQNITDFIQKPYDLMLFIEKICKHLRQP